MLKVLSPSDHQLIDMIKKGGAGEERAIRHLLKRNGEMIKTFIRKNNGSAEEAEEVLYDAITSMLFNIRSGKFEGQSSLSTYLFAIAKRRWYKVFAKRTNHEQQHQDWSETLEQHEAFEDRSLVQAETGSILADLLARLHQGCREVITFWSQHYSMDEIAKAMGYKNSQVAMNKKSNCFKQLLMMVNDNPQLRATLAELRYT